MKILIIHAHGNNRGDEAAVKSMVDEITAKYPGMEIVISGEGLNRYPLLSANVKQISRFPKNYSKTDQLSFLISLLTRGKIALTNDGKEFIKVVKSTNLVVHAPGGPAIGDIYGDDEWLYLWRLNFIRRLGLPYIFYAPSMGPFITKRNNKLRKKVLRGAERIILRDPISAGYVKDFLPDIDVEQALDSALQHDIMGDMRVEKTFKNCKELQKFLSEHPKVIGITITDLMWHPQNRNHPKTRIIASAFEHFIERRINQEYGIVFIPQLYGEQDDREYMLKFAKNSHIFVLDNNQEVYDSYFQQYLIGQLYAVVGMRYHSNIFSAKMGTPFLSISYEQKMEGFMRAIGMEKYCIRLEDFSEEELEGRFRQLETDYEIYCNDLQKLHSYMKKESYKSTEALIEMIEKIQ